MKKLMILVLVLCVAGSASAYTCWFNNAYGAGDNDYYNPANYYNSEAPDSTDDQWLGDFNGGLCILSGGSSTIKKIEVARNGGNLTFRQTGGSLTLTQSLYIHTGGSSSSGGHGTYEMQGGTLDVQNTQVPRGGNSTGVMTQTGGEIITRWLEIPNSGDPGNNDTGTYSLLGGTTTVTYAMNIGGNAGDVGTVYVGGGTLIFTDDDWTGMTSTYQGREASAAWIADGRMVPASGYTGISAIFDGTNTYITGIPEPATIALLGLGGLALIRRKK